MSFTKLDSGIVNSSIWNEPPETRVVWITILAMSDENGFVATARSGLMRAANIPTDKFDLAILTLESPDPESRSPDNDGRRIVKIEGGWIIQNHDKYRTRSDIIREQTRNRVRKYRDSQHNVTQCNACNACNVTHALPSVSVSVSESVSVLKEGIQGGNDNLPLSDLFEQFWKAYPRKQGKGQVLKIWSKIKEPSETLKKILSALEWQKNTEQWTKENGQFIPMPATYLNQQRWLDENKISDDDTAAILERIRLKKERGEL